MTNGNGTPPEGQPPQQTKIDEIDNKQEETANIEAPKPVPLEELVEIDRLTAQFVKGIPIPAPKPTGRQIVREGGPEATESILATPSEGALPKPPVSEGVVNTEKMFTGPNQEILVCPSLTGGKNYHAGAYSPQTKLMYMPLQNVCMMSTSTAARPSLDELYAIRTKDQLAPGEQNVGTIEAINVETGRTAWKHEQRAGQTSLMTTASGLLFGGDCPGEMPYEGIKGVSLTLNYGTIEDAQRVFAGLSEGGTITMAMQPSFWAKTWGMLVDRFGTPWIVNGEMLQY